MAVDPTKIYELQQEIGKGAFGMVYKAKHRKSKEVVAIKTIPVAGRKDAEAVMKEVSCLMECKSDYIIKMMDTPYLKAENGGYAKTYSCWVVLEYCAGGDLEKYIKRCDEKVLNKIMHDTLKGLQYLHSKALIHRDIKPHNILHDSGSGTFKLGDLGNTKNIDVSTAKTAIGTATYQAPEIEDGKYTNKVDIYSWGVTIKKLAAKQTSTVKAITGNCCQFFPEKRPSASQLLVALFQK
mmetsp:Transcript_31248/g.27489  ORF Transcript_31248/g.27489 Transcript_31248/m.27489 type:complete len:238 (+) Transcript_31248:30-743(+)